MSELRQREPRVEHPAYLAYVRTLPCTVSGKAPPSDAAHLRAAAEAYGKRATGKAEKSHDWWVLPLSREMHAEQHTRSELDWWASKGIPDPFALAVALYANRPPMAPPRTSRARATRKRKPKSERAPVLHLALRQRRRDVGERIFIDCEFNGFGGELISMALVAEDGGEWYGVLSEPRVWNEWCYEHVFPVLSDVSPTTWLTSREDFRRELFEFLSSYDNPTIVADWYTDLYHFFDAFRGKDHADSIAFPCRAELVLDVPGYAPKVPHNALSDARAIRDALAAKP